MVWPPPPPPPGIDNVAWACVFRRDILAAGVPRAVIPIGSRLLCTQQGTPLARWSTSRSSVSGRGGGRLDSPLDATFFSAMLKGS